MKPTYSILAFLTSLASAQAQIIAPQTDLFSGGGGGSAATGIYTNWNASVGIFNLEQTTITDGTFLDTLDDGYAYIHRTATSSATIGFSGALGTIEAGDVGKKVSIDVAFRTAGSSTVNFNIRLDGGEVGGQGKMNVNTFGSGNASNNSNLLLSTVVLGTQNSQRLTPGPLEYTIQTGDVGKVLSFSGTLFDSTNNGSGEGSRNLAVDAVDIAIIDTPAAEFYWDGTGTGWDSAAAWSLSSTDDTVNPVSPPDGSANVNFGSDGLVSDQTVNLNGDQAAARMLISSPLIYNFLGGSGTSSLTVGVGGISVGAAPLGVNFGSAVAGQEVNLVLGDSQTWSNASAMPLVAANSVDIGAFQLAIGGIGDTALNGSVDGIGVLRKIGTGALALNGPSTLSGAKRLDNGSITVSGNRSGSTGSWVIRGFGDSGTNYGSIATTLNFASGSTIAVASGNTVQIGNTASVGGFSGQKLNSEGTVTNDGSLYVGRVGDLILNGGVWTQNGEGSVVSQGGGSALMAVNAGAAFTYSNAAPFILRTSPSSTVTTLLRIDGGTFTTGTSFDNTITPGGSNSGSRITLNNDGTLKLSADVADLFTTAGATNEVFCGSGQGIIDTNGFSTTLNVAVSGAGGLTKSGTGTLTTTGTNSYTGNTVVTAGTLSVAGANLDDASSVTVASGGAKLDLAFVGNDNIASLTLGATTYTSNANGPFDAATYPAFLSGSGVLVVGGAAPTFASWAAGLGLSGNPDSDFENDGVADGVEYVLGTDPKVSSPTGITTTQAGTDMTFTFSRDDQSETADLTLMVEAGPDLQSWPQAFQIGDTTANSSAGVVITENGAGADTVVVTIPKGSAVKFFARMKVVVSGS